MVFNLAKFREFTVFRQKSAKGDTSLAYQVVIIDDEREISSGFAQFFPWKDLGFSVKAQFSGAKSALQFILKNPVDLVVSDVLIPGMTGIELAKELSEREMEKRPVVILFSAYNKFEYVRDALRYGCRDYILKSTEFDELVKIFKSLKNRMDKERGNDGSFGSGGGAIIESVKKYIRENLKNANLEEASALVYLSPSYLSHYFRQRTGTGFSSYVTEQKMRSAISMLQELHYKIYDVSAQLGYANPENFTRAFKKYHGCSPHVYRFHKPEKDKGGDEHSGG
jgi:YesN/AraC family two-component response regulator